jgi:hypothetical protein
LRPRQSHKGLTCWPLVDAADRHRQGPWRALAAALEDGFASVELSDSLDDRCRVRISNRSAQPLVALSGEELPGADAGLCANRSAIVPARGSVVVEAALLPAPAGRCVELSRLFCHVEGQVGFVAAIGDEVVGIERVADPQLFAAVAPTLRIGYAVEAVAREHSARERRVRFDAPESFLAELAGARLKPTEDPDAPLRLTAAGIVGKALCSDGAAVHLSAYPIAV